MNSLQSLPIEQLQPNPFQPREKIKKEELQELTASIEEHGVLEPLVVAQTPAGYQIIAGERRWRASKEAGLKEVPVVVRKTTPKGMLEMAIVENVQRSDLNAMERAQAFMQLIRNFGYAQSEIAKKISKSTSFVGNTIRLLNLPDAIKDGLIGGLISEGHARAIYSIGDEKIMVECYKQILKEGASVRRAEELSRHYKDRHNLRKANDGKQSKVEDDKLATVWNEHLQHNFNTKAKVKLNRSMRQTKITLTLKGSPEKTQADLEKMMQLLTE
jgi:ParB family chromosome partitioning protein